MNLIKLKCLQNFLMPTDLQNSRLYITFLNKNDKEFYKFLKKKD